MTTVENPTTPAAGEDLTKRGARRREELLQAALELVVREGHHALTLRSVANEAKASHGLVTYYFGSRDALVSQVLEYVCQQTADVMASITEGLKESASDPADFAKLLAQRTTEQMVSNRSMGLAISEFNLAAVRNPKLRPIIYKWGQTFALLFKPSLLALGSTNPAADHALLINAMNGLIMGQLAMPRRDFERRILRPALVRLAYSIAGKQREP